MPEKHREGGGCEFVLPKEEVSSANVSQGRCYLRYTLKLPGKVCQAEKKLRALKWPLLKANIKIVSKGCVHMRQNNWLMNGEVTKMIIWPWADQKGKLD